jgi:hypothetical protein
MVARVQGRARSVLTVRHEGRVACGIGDAAQVAVAVVAIAGVFRDAVDGRGGDVGEAAEAVVGVGVDVAVGVRNLGLVGAVGVGGDVAQVVFDGPELIGTVVGEVERGAVFLRDAGDQVGAALVGVFLCCKMPCQRNVSGDSWKS